MLHPNAIKNLIAPMTLDEPDTNMKAVKEIIKLGPEATGQVCDLIEQEPERFKKVKLIEALAFIADGTRADWVMKCTADAEDNYLLSAWIKAAGMICGRKSLPELKNIARASDDPRVLANLVELLGGSGDLTHVPFLKSLIHHQDNRVQGNALMAIVRLAESLKGETVQHINHMTESENESQRLTAEYILRTLNIRHPASPSASSAGLFWRATGAPK